MWTAEICVVYNKTTVLDLYVVFTLQQPSFIQFVNMQAWQSIATYDTN